MIGVFELNDLSFFFLFLFLMHDIIDLILTIGLSFYTLTSQKIDFASQKTENNGDI